MRITVQDKAEYALDLVLYNGACDCGQRLDWEAQFDADGTTYTAACCGFAYWIAPHTVIASKELIE